MIGRGTRKHPGKTDCLVLDVTGIATYHGLMSVAALGGLPPKAMSGKTLTEAVAEAGQRRQQQISMAGRTQQIDLFRSRMRWLPLEDGFVLPAGKSRDFIILPEKEAPDRWRVFQNQNAVARELVCGLDLGYALGYAEDKARQAGDGWKLGRTGSRWLREEPTDPQYRWLKRAGLQDLERVRTRGEASDLITLIQARRAIRRLAEVQ